ncbi:MULTISPECIES: hypothetical protein [unclassified Halobacteriovorax]|uniref:hypothetical protein n=1 Tax=unclassified Halobacteriovorax TaxID=2639665 RepID=UPI00399C02BF
MINQFNKKNILVDSKGMDGAIQLLLDNSELIEFTKKIPYGLTIDQCSKNKKIEISVQPTYFVLSVGSDTHPWGCIPALERVNLSVNEGIHFTDPFENKNLNELAWLYSFAKAKERFSTIGYNHLCSHIQEVWKQIANLIINGEECGIVPFYASCFRHYNHPAKEYLKSYTDATGEKGWHDALESENFNEFLSKIGIHKIAPLKNNFCLLQKPRKRTVVYKSYGRIHGVMATDQGKFAKTVDELKGLAFWSSRNPLMFADHDLDRPIGLIYNPHYNFNLEKNRNELIYSLIITDEYQWKNREKYKGSSLGVYHE